MFKEFKTGLLFVVFMSLVGWASPTLANDFENGVRAYNEGRYADAATAWEKAATKAGDSAAAQYNLATLYEVGQGVERHLGRAAYYLKLASEQGYTLAKFRLGQLYFNNDSSFPKNVNAALFWWESAANDGDIESQLALATLYLQGVDIQKDLLVARYWLQQAAARNDPRATTLLQQLISETEEYKVYDANWILAQDPELFTIELFGSKSQDEAEAFAYRNGLRFSAMYQSIYGDYIVIAGLFDSLQGAYNQIASFSDSMKAFKPRPRSLSVLMAELQNVNANAEIAGAASSAVEIPTEEVVSVLGAEWIREQNTIFYTIQLYAAESRAQAELFVQQAGIDNAAMYRNVGAQYIVVAGVFSDLQQAQQAADLLPRNLRRFNPAPRVFAEVKRDLLLAEDNALNQRNPVNAGFDVLNLNIPVFTPAESTKRRGSVNLTTVSGSEIDSANLEAIGLVGKDVILSLPPEKFTIELYRGTSLKGVQDFVQEYGVSTGASYISNDGHYAIVSGLLNTPEDAFAEIKKLPQSARSYNPVIRQISVVQSEITSNEAVNLNTSRGLRVVDQPGWQWILSIDPRKYTVLLFESPSFFGATEFVKKFGVQDAVILKSKKRRKPYQVISGIYDTTKQAGVAKKQVSEAQQKVYRPNTERISNMAKKLADPWQQPGIVKESSPTGFFPYSFISKVE